MSFIAGDVKRILKIKLKPRQDDYSDQFNRIFMMKMCLVSALLVGFDYFHDQVSCTVPKTAHMTARFVHSTCWIQGFYVYEQMAGKYNESGYFGIPRDVSYDGVDIYNGELCKTNKKSYVGSHPVQTCIPMTKVYYIQYQYMPFFIGGLAILFYLPYIIFKLSNNDIFSLKDSLKGADGSNTVKSLTNNFFNPKINSHRRMGLRVASNILIKVLYLSINTAVFAMCDSVLYGKFNTYGIDWTRWMRMKFASKNNFNQLAEPTPGNKMLPSMAFCEITEASKDIRTNYFNKYKFVCELSPHILYHYVLLVLWFALIAGIIVSALGLARLLVNYVITIYFKNKKGNTLATRVYHVLNLREIEYLELIRKKSLPLYGDVMRKLRMDRAALGNVDEMFEHSTRHDYL